MSVKPTPPDGSPHGSHQVPLEEGQRPSDIRPFLAPASRSVSSFAPSQGKPVQRALGPTSAIHFHVHPGMDEVVRFAADQGWNAQGWSRLSVLWVDMVYTTDAWKTTKTLRSTDVPSPIVDELFYVPDVERGTEIEFAIHVGVGCAHPDDLAGYRERADVWLNNGDKNFKQVTR